MSNFAARLTELMERATKGELRYDHMGTCSHTGKPYGDINPHFAESVYKDDFEYIKLLFDHAPAIRDLVRAAEKAAAMQIAEQWELQEALAKLEEE